MHRAAYSGGKTIYGFIVYDVILPVIYVVFAGQLCYYRISNFTHVHPLKDGSRLNAEGTHLTVKRRVSWDDSIIYTNNTVRQE